MVRNDLTELKSAIVLLDPHGSLINDISRFSEFTDSERLVLVSPNLSAKHQITINPFEVSDTSESGIETQSSHLTSAFEQILGGFTLNLESLIDERKAILFDLSVSGGSKSATIILGQFTPP